VERADFVVFVIAPVLVIINAVAVSLIVLFLLNFFKDTVLTRLLKIILAPLAFIAVMFVYLEAYFDFDFWLEGILEQQSWSALSAAEQSFTFLPLTVYILLRAVCYVLGRPRGGEEEAAENAVVEGEQPEEQK